MSTQKVSNIFKIASVYIGTVIGAGFASGQEIIKFFISYGLKGIIGIILAGVLHGLVGVMILDIVYEKKFSSYGELIGVVMGKKLGAILNVSITTFLFVCFSAMIAGAGAIFNQQFGMQTWVGAIAMVMVTTITFFTGSKGFVRMNSILVPVLCIGGFVLGCYIVIFNGVNVFNDQIGDQYRGWEWLLSCLNYVSYNTLTVLVVLASMGKMITAKSVVRWSGIIAGIGLGLLGLSIGLCTYLYFEEVKMVEIPMLKLLEYHPNILRSTYEIVLVLAMYTTAIANGYGVIENITQRFKIRKGFVIIGMSLLGLLGVNIGFSNIVKYIFPVFGYVGFFEIIMLLVYYGFMKWEKKQKYRRNKIDKKEKHQRF